MLLIIILTGVVTTVIAAILTLRSMRGVDVIYYVMNGMMKSGVMTLLVKTGLIERMRPKATEVVALNGFKIMGPNPMFGISLEPALKFKTRRDDIFLATYPKAGTTWIQEITWLICNNADIESAKRESVTARSPFLEAVDLGEVMKGIQSLENWPTEKQRIIKTHLPYELLPEEFAAGKKCKIICVARNPKDLCVSYYFFHLMSSGMPQPGTWSEFLTKFCSGEVGWGSWFNHTIKYWKKYQEDKERIYFTTYEAMKKDLRSELTQIAKFLEKDLSDEQLDAIARHCTFESMSKNKNTNYSPSEKYGMDFKKAKFMRKGQVGDWKNHFTLNENTAFDAMYEEKLKGSGLYLQFELEE